MSVSHASIHHSPASGEPRHGTDIGKILDRGGIVTGHQTTSKKKLLEQLADMFAEQLPGANAGQIFNTLIERENLGSTGIGSGVALPHGRIPGLKNVAGIFLHLQEPLEYDAVDHLPVNLIFAILVPEEATEEHLKLLASLAGVFRDEETREKLLEISEPSLIRDLFEKSVENGDQY